MFAPSYLSLSRHNIYYIRCPIPKNLHPQGKASEIKLSLQTRCPREALRYSRNLIYAVEQITEWAEMSGIEYSKMREVIGAYCQEQLDRFKHRLDKDGAMNNRTKEGVENSLSFTKEAIDDNDMLELYTDQKVLLAAKNMGLPVQIDTHDYNVFKTEYMKASRDLFKSILDYNKGFDEYRYDEHIRNIGKSNHRNTTFKKKLSELIALYMDEKIRTGEWKPQTAKGFKSQFDFLQEYLGIEATLNTANDKAYEVYTSLLRLPKQSRSNPKYKSFSISELLEQEHTDCMSAVNVQKYVQAYSAFFDWAIALNHCETNSFKTLIKKSIKGNDRKPFTLDQIHLILDRLKKESLSKEYQYWGVLLGIYTGARLNEIAQLELCDIKQQDGIYYLEITDTGDGKKSLKNAASKRFIPIHSQLIDLGFIEYVEKLRTAGKQRLLHELTYNKNNGYGRNLGRWFNDKFLPSLGLKTEGLAYHSMRHTMTTALLQADVEEAIVKSIIGHAKTGVTHKVYGKAGYKLSQLSEAIEKVTYS